MPKEVLDTRKLKDSAAEFLKKSKFEKAAEILEQLAQGEPKEMQHRLRLGDCYRRLGQLDKSVLSYQAAARHFADQGQLIKAIGAIKVILEIDPRNRDALQQLAEMNELRLGKVTLETAGLAAPPKATGAKAPTGPIELREPERPLTEKVPPAPTRGAQRGAMADQSMPSDHDLDPGLDDEPLEL